MFTARRVRKDGWSAAVWVSVLLLSTVYVPGSAPAPALAQKSKASPLLKRLIEDARKEGALDLTVVSSQGEKGAKELTDAFKRRLELDIKINVDLSGQESQKFNQAVAEAKGKIPPTFDLIGGTAENVLALKEAGGAEAIENWQDLLAEVVPEAYKVKDQISPTVLSGYGFLWGTRTVGLLYNPKILPEPEIPRTWKEMASPKYAGAFSVPPWISHAVMGIMEYDKKGWLEIVRGWGRNKRQILTYEAGIQRMLLGEIKFLYSNDYYYYEHKARDANAPIETSYFEDITLASESMYVVRKGTRHVNAAKLFALWATSSEANLIYEKHAYHPNLVLGSGPISKKIAQLLKARNIKPKGWFDNAQNLEKFLWLRSEEGVKYQQALAEAHRTGK